MRRHYRNHSRSVNPDSDAVLSKDIRAQMREMSGSTSPGSRPLLSPSDRGLQQPPMSSSPGTYLSSSECSDEEMIFDMDHSDHFTEEDEPDGASPVDRHYRDEQAHAVDEGEKSILAASRREAITEPSQCILQKPTSARTRRRLCTPVQGGAWI